MDNKSTIIKERVLQIAKHHSISYESFCEKISMTYSNFKGANKNTPLNSNTLDTILTLFSDINPEWLICGKNPMLRDQEKPSTHTITAI